MSAADRRRRHLAWLLATWHYYHPAKPVTLPRLRCLAPPAAY